MCYVTVGLDNQINGIWTGDSHDKLMIVNGVWYGKFTNNRLSHYIFDDGIEHIIPTPEWVRESYKIVPLEFSLQSTDYNDEIERAQMMYDEFLKNEEIEFQSFRTWIENNCVRLETNTTIDVLYDDFKSYTFSYIDKELFILFLLRYDFTVINNEVKGLRLI